LQQILSAYSHSTKEARGQQNPSLMVCRGADLRGTGVPDRVQGRAAAEGLKLVAVGALVIGIAGMERLANVAYEMQAIFQRRSRSSSGAAEVSRLWL